MVTAIIITKGEFDGDGNGGTNRDEARAVRYVQWYQILAPNSLKEKKELHKHKLLLRAMMIKSNRNDNNSL